MSLRSRLVLATCLVALVALVGAGFATYAAFSRSQLRQVDKTLQLAHEPIEQATQQPDSDGDDVDRIASGLFVAVLESDGTPMLSVPAREPGHPSIEADLTQISGGSGLLFETVGATSGGDMRVRVSSLPDGRVLVIGVSLHELVEARRHLVLIEVLAAVVALLLAAIVGWFVIGVSLRPLRKVEQTALAIASGGDLSHDVPGADDRTEVGRLAGAINTMLDRIRSAFRQRDETVVALRESEERMRQFLADASHELRTPLAAVSAYSELFERGARDHPEDLERALRGISAETERMHELVEELMLLARLDEGRPLSRVQVDLESIVVDAIAAARAMSPDWPVSLDASEAVEVEGDAGRLRQVVDNILANVRMHTPAGTSTIISIAADDKGALLTISDNGPGMAAADAAHVFDRFYRADPSRARASGGSGLGMAIVQALVHAHGGQISVATAPGQGMTISITLPLAQRPARQLVEEGR